MKTMAAAAQDTFKESRKAILDDFPITSKLVNKLINFEYSRNFDVVSTEWEETIHAYEKLNSGEKTNE